jgi:kynurenine formamidase
MRPATCYNAPVTDLARALGAARAYDLEQPRYAGAPVFPAHEPGVLIHLHRRHERDAPEARTSASALLVMTEHSGTHIDALCHQAYGGRLHGDVEVDARVQTSTGFTALGIDTVPPLLARGVLLDVPRALGVERLEAGFAVGAAELEQAARGLEIEPGDVVLVRLGCGALWADRPAYMRAGGIAAEGSRWVAQRAPLAVGIDNLTWDLADDRDPELGSLPGHTILLVRAGIHIIEAMFLEELAADGVREFAFVCLPLKLRGGTGSPVRPLALV